MKVTLVFVLLACLAACAFASRSYGYDSYNRDGFTRVHNGISAAYGNDDRQRAVNRRAEYVGASSGTAKYYDVPGTGRNFGYGNGYSHGGYRGYGDGYGYNDGYVGGHGYNNRH